MLFNSELTNVNLCFFFCLRELYDPGALIMEEEGVVIVGMLVGLNVIDANLCVKGEDLDSQVKHIAIHTMLSDDTDAKHCFCFCRWASLTSQCI